MIYYDGKWYTSSGIITEIKNTGVLTIFSNGQKRLTFEVEMQKRRANDKFEVIGNRMVLKKWGYEIAS
jgi:hypothetical protein